MALLFIAAAPPPDPCNDKLAASAVGGEAAYQQRRRPEEGDPYCEGVFSEPVSGLPDFAIVEYSFGSRPAASTLGVPWYIFWPHDKRPVRIHGEPRSALVKYALDGAESTPEPDDAVTLTDWFKWDTTVVRTQIGEKADIALSVFALDEIAVDDPDATRRLMLPTKITIDERPEALQTDLTFATVELRSTLSTNIRHIELRPFTPGRRDSRVYTPDDTEGAVSRSMTFLLDLEFGEDKLPLDGSIWQLIIYHSDRPGDDVDLNESRPLYLVMPPRSFVMKAEPHD